MAFVLPRTSVLDGVAKLPQWLVTFNVVTGARALDTIYQNTTGRPLFCMVTCICARTIINDEARLNADVKATSPPNVSYIGSGLSNVGPITEQIFCVTFLVPPFWYYRITSTTAAGGAVTLDGWVEGTL